MDVKTRLARRIAVVATTVAMVGSGFVGTTISANAGQNYTGIPSLYP